MSDTVAVTAPAAAPTVADPTSTVDTVKGMVLIVSVIGGTAMVAGVRDPANLAVFSAGVCAVLTGCGPLGSRVLEFSLLGGGVASVVWSLYSSFGQTTKCKCTKGCPKC
jgi:hypothetical protein